MPDMFATWVRNFTLLGHELVEYGCAEINTCGGFSTGKWAIDAEDDGQGRAAALMREHILSEHPRHAPYGPCAVCGRRTDYFHADSADGRLWLCERDAPAMPAEGGEVIRGAE